MKFVELKESLKKEVLPNYFLQGDDFFLMHNALGQIKAAIAGDFGDFNTTTFCDDDGHSAEDITNACLNMPFGGGKRLVIVKGSCIKKEDKGLEKLTNIIKQKNEHLALVFFAQNEDEIFSVVKPLCNLVDCDKISAITCVKYIKTQLAKAGVQISDENANLIANLCQNQMAKISGEVTKLAILARSNDNQVNEQLIYDTIERDVEHLVFELGDFICKKDVKNSFVCLENLLANKQIRDAVLPTLYSFFSRAFFATVTKDDAIVSRELKTKPYAVQKAREMTKHFTPKELIKILKQLVVADYNTKIGKVKLDEVLFLAVCNILSA